MSFLADLLQNTSNALSNVGVKTPELGWTEKTGGSNVAPNHSVAPSLDFTNQPAGAGPMSPLGATGGLGASIGSAFALPGTQAAGGSIEGGGGGGGVSSADLAYLDDQAQQLRDLLSRTNTGLDQGLAQNQDEYDRQLGSAEAQKARQLAAYGDQRVSQNQGKLDTYGTINKNANSGYNSLAQIIGRASGTGSSAFRELLPNVIGKETSSQRSKANQTYGQNLQGIDKAEGQYNISFADVLDDLLRQKKDNENTLRSGIESQRQNLNGQLGTVAGQKAQALGGGYAQVKAAQQPFQNNINSSRDQVESFFNQFRTPYTAKTAVAAAPDLSQYTTDRSVINAQNQGAVDPTNPYAALLRKKQGGVL